MLAPHHSIAALTLACALALLAQPACAGPRYTLTALPAGTSVGGLNELGQVAGYIGTADGPRAYVWSRDGLTRIVSPPGTSTGFATAINNRGDVAGYAIAPDDQWRAFRYDGGGAGALDVFGASAYAQALNDRGQIAGGYVRGSSTRAFVYGDGVATDLGTLGGSFASANGINSAGQVVGFSTLDDNAAVLAHAFLYSDGVMTDLGTMGGASLSEATAINDRGQITGHGWVEGSQHAFLYEEGVMRDLGTLGGRYSFAYDINNAGQIVGWSNEPGDFGGFAFLWDGSSMVNLNALIEPGSGWILHEARGINDRQQIAAFGCRDEVCGAVLLELAPAAVPEPGSWLLMLAGLGVMGWRRVSASCRYGQCHLRHTARRT